MVKKRKYNVQLTPPSIAIPQRARIISEVIRDTVKELLHEDGVPHLVFMVVHGLAKKSRQVHFIAQPHWATETVEELMRESLLTYEKWGSLNEEDFEHTDLVNSAVNGLLKAVEALTRQDIGFGETAIMGLYPS